MAKLNFKVGDTASFKVKTITATFGHEDKENRRKSQYNWIHEGKKEFTLISFLTAGRGWMRKSTPHVLKAGSAKIDVRIIDIDEKNIATVQILNGLDLETMEYAKRPYVRKDGSSAPQVAVIYDFEGVEMGTRILRKCYGVSDYTVKPFSTKWVKKTFSHLSYVDELCNSVTCVVMLKDLVK